MHTLNATARAGTSPQNVSDAFDEEVHAMESFVEMGGDATDLAEVAEAEALAIEQIAENPASDPHALTAAAHAEAETIEDAAMTGHQPWDVVKAVSEESERIKHAEPWELDQIAEDKNSENSELMGAVEDTGFAAVDEAGVVKAAAAANVSAASILQGAIAAAEALEEAVAKGATSQELVEVAEGAEVEAESHAAEAGTLKMVDDQSTRFAPGCACLANMSHMFVGTCVFKGMPGILNMQGSCFPKDYGVGKCSKWDDDIDVACTEAAEGEKPGYCEQPWCYVDEFNCDRDQHKGGGFPDVAYSYDTCDYAKELTPAHPEIADMGIAAEIHILNATALAGITSQEVSEAFSEEVHAMQSLVDMGADSNALAAVAETEALAVEVVAEEGLGPHTLRDAAHAEAETIETFALTGDSPAAVLEAVHKESDVVELARPSELRDMAAESEDAASEVQDAVADTGRAAMKTADAISQAAAFGVEEHSGGCRG
jgi:hypothetical protein